MARIRVGTGLFHVPLLEALRRSKPGDELMIAEGVHSAPDGIVVTALTLTGIGDPSRIVLETRIQVRGTATISRLTVKSPPFHNALTVDAGSKVNLSSVVVLGDPANKYPALYATSASVALHSCRVVQPDFPQPVQLAKDSWFTAEDSILGGVHAVGGQVVLTRCSAGLVSTTGRTRFFGRGRLESTAGTEHRALVIEDESVADIEWLTLDDATSGEAWCQESMLRIGRLEAPEGVALEILHKGAGRVDADDPRISVIDPDNPEPKPERARWPLSEGNHVLDQLAKVRPGGTVELEAGEYALDDCTDRWVRATVRFEGAGERATIVHGTFEPFEDGTVVLSNLTLRVPAGRPAIRAGQGTVVLENVTIEQATGGERASVLVAGGTVVMRGCTVRSSGQALEGSVVVTQKGTLQAERSALGWCRLQDQASAALADTSARWLLLEGASSLVGTGTHRVLGNTCAKRVVVVNGGSSLTLARLHIGSTRCEAHAQDSAVELTKLVAEDDGHLTLHIAGSVSGTVPDSAAFTLVRDGVVQAQAVAEEPPSEPDGEPQGPLEQLESVEQEGLEEQPVEQQAEASRGPVADDSPQAPDEETAADPMAEIMLLTGLPQVKEQVRSFLTMVRFNELRRQQGLKASAVTMHSLFLGPPGTGKTTVARLLGKALHQAGAVRTDTFVEVGRRDLVSENLGGSARLTGQVLERARGGVLFIDEAYSLYQKEHNQFAQEAVDTILAFMENHRDDLVVIFAGYEEQMQDFLRMNPGLASRTPNTFTFTDYTADEVASIGLQSLAADDYVVDEDLYRRIVVRKYSESVTGGNGRWVRNLNEELVKCAAARIVAQLQQGSTDVDPSRITDEDLYQLAGGDEIHGQAAVAALLEQLDELIGLAPVKDFVRGLVQEAEANRLLADRGMEVERPSYHMVFSGSPGTGKTTVASIVAQLFHHLGLLARPSVTEVDRSQLVGSYSGHTEERTTRAIDNAMGGVLFVDEAYQLAPRGENDFGRMAIETMITRLENDRDKFVAIFAGYTKEMENFLAANEGLRSRIPLTIEFPDYSPDEIGQMVVARLSRTWTVDEAQMARIASELYAQLPASERSNGRWARTFAEAVVKQHKAWIVTDGAGVGDVSTIATQTVAQVAATWR